jgi:hypothetical protein
MAVSVKLEGLEQFRAALRNLPQHLADEAAAVVLDAAGDAKGEVQSSYTEGPTGNLRRGVTVKQEHGRFGVRATVRSRAQHAHLYEQGTGQRRTRTGANRGRMPQAPQEKRMIPIVIRHRKRMEAKLKDVVRKNGFQVD